MKLDCKEKTSQLPKTFYVTYYAKKHQAIVTRKGQWHKPVSDIVGRYFVDKNNQHNFIYWDINAEPNKNGNQWRHAVGMINVKAID